MDIHRTRLTTYTPSAITTLSFTHTTGASLRGQPLKLALGRANGDIEIWNPSRGAWVQELIIRGGEGRSCEGLVWVHEPASRLVQRDGAEGTTGGEARTSYGRARLFSIGYSASVVEWDIITGLPRRESSGVGGAVWCLAVQPAMVKKKVSKTQRMKKRKEKKRLRVEGDDASKIVDEAGKQELQEEEAIPTEEQHQHLVAGCADGTLVLLSTEDDDLVFKRYIARASKKNARALSLCFQDRYTVVAGFSDSTIRVYDIRTGTLLRNMSLGGGPQGGPKDKLVWAVESLKDGTIVSGDSSGEVTFWDGRTYGILQRIKGHEADTLCLTTSEDGHTVFSGGMDRKTCVYHLNASEGQRKYWSKTMHRRFHQHDVKAMARFDSAKMSVVVSGGLDTTPILIPLREIGNENHRTLPFVPQMPPVAGAGHYVATWQDREITIWRVGSSHNDEEDSSPYEVVARLALNGEEHISSLSLSSDARLLAVSTAAEIKIFTIRKSNSESGLLKARKVELPTNVSGPGARLVMFSPDSKWLLLISAASHLRLARIVPSTEEKSSVHVLPTLIKLRRLHREMEPQNCFNGSWGSYDRTITRAAFSSDSRMLAVSDLAGYIDAFNLEGVEADGPAGGLRSHHEVGAAAPPSPPSSVSDGDDKKDSDDSDVSMASASYSFKKSKRPTTIYNQHWRLIPSAHLLPRASSAPIILSFRPSTTTSNLHPAHGHTHTHTHPHEHEKNDELLILTSTHDLTILSLDQGKLTPWSRRNPTTYAPDQFKLQRDRAVGCLWDMRPADKERVWLYGATWICMFDLSVDFARPASAATATFKALPSPKASQPQLQAQSQTQAQSQSQPQSQSQSQSQSQQNNHSATLAKTHSANSTDTDKDTKKRKRERSETTTITTKTKTKTKAQRNLFTQLGTIGAAGSRTPASDQLGLVSGSGSGSVQVMKGVSGKFEEEVEMNVHPSRRRNFAYQGANDDGDDGDGDVDMNATISGALGGQEMEPEDEIAYLTQPVNGSQEQEQSATSGQEEDGDGDGDGDGDTAGEGEEGAEGATKYEKALLTKKQQKAAFYRQQAYLSLARGEDGEDEEKEEEEGEMQYDAATGEWYVQRRNPTRSGEGYRGAGAQYFTHGRGEFRSLDGSFFITTRYRPILGIVPLTSLPTSTAAVEHNGRVNGEGEAENTVAQWKGEYRTGRSRQLEVCLLERPFWDLKLPPRFVGANERERSKN